MPSRSIPVALLCGATSRLYGDRLVSLAFFGESVPVPFTPDLQDNVFLNLLMIARTLPRTPSDRLLEFESVRSQLPEWLRPRVRCLFFTSEELEKERPEVEQPVLILLDDGTLKHFLGLGEGLRPPKRGPTIQATRRRRGARGR